MNLKDLSDFTKSPWSFVVALVVLLVVWEGGKKWLPTLVEWLVRQLRDALAGTPVMRRRALRTYRQRVASRYAKLPVLFMPDKGLDASTVYVPLQAVEIDGDQAGDAYERIKATEHVIVLGDPGAGKTMLLRHSMLTWARDPTWRRTQRVPVLLELHRCAGDPRSIEEHVIAQFEEDGFAKAGRFVQRALCEGKLSLLFDGLDEVTSVERSRVVQMLRRFAARYPDCQIVLTCRTAIYNQQLAPEITTLFRVDAFDDQHIQRFLKQWPLVADESAANRLFAALSDSPRIMQLARNPLLLTMVAYLYGGRPQNQLVLPHSRAEFYHEAIDILLDRLKDSRNTFKGPVKKAVLLRLALAVQQTTGNPVDRRTLGYEDVIAEITALAPRLNLLSTDADLLLDEIVGRSGLLLRVDGGARYQFAHLSLQEYLAAVAYERDWEGLLRRYREAPDDWREVVKLWCGAVSTDCGPLIDAVFRIDEVLAFECLADAQVVDEAVAHRITGHFQKLLLQARSRLDRTVINAFGLVAADPRPRGQRVLKFLTEHALTRHGSAFEALAATKLPAAADTLVELLVNPSAWFATMSMGDLAVPALTRATGDRRADIGVQAVDLLADIATPSAIDVLVRLLRGNDKYAYQAAWRLAALLARPDVEAVLADLDVPYEVPSHAWVWEPFRDRRRPSVAKIAARIAQLCESCPRTELPHTRPRIDPRLAIPLMMLGFNGHMGRLLSRLPRAMRRLNRLQPYGRHSDEQFLSVPVRRAVRSHADIVRTATDLIAPHVSATELAFYSAIDPQLRGHLFTRLVDRGITVRRQDWAQVNRGEKDFDFRTSWLFRTCVGVVVSCWVTVGVGMFALVARGWPWIPGWLGWTVLAVGVAYGSAVLYEVLRWGESARLAAMSVVTAPALFYPGRLRSAEFVNFCAGVGMVGSVLGFVIGPVHPGWLGLFVMSVAATFISMARPRVNIEDVLYGLGVGFGAMTLTTSAVLVWGHYLGWWAMTGLMVAVLSLCLALFWYGAEKRRASQNPLRGLLELDRAAARLRTSVVAP